MEDISVSRSFAAARVRILVLLNNRFMMGCIMDSMDPYTLSKPIELVVQNAGKGQISIGFGMPSMPFNMPSNEKISFERTAVVMSFDLDHTNKDLLDNYRQQISGIITSPNVASNILNGGNYR